MYNIAICADKDFIQYLKEKICQCSLGQNDIKFYDFLSGEKFVNKEIKK